MLTQQKRPKNAELLELARIQDELDAMREVFDAARSERQAAERRADQVQAAEFEDWRRAMRESGRAHEIHKGKLVEPRSAERVATERAVEQAQVRETVARRRSLERGEETSEYHNTFSHFTEEDQRRLIRLRGWPTDGYMKAVREDLKDPSRPRWSDDEVTAREAARATAQH